MTTKIDVIRSSDELEQKVIDTLTLWFPTYLEEIRLQRLQTDHLPSPASYMSSPEIDHFLEKQLPAVIVVSPGLAEAPFHDSDGYYHVSWRIGVAIVASAVDKASVNRNVKQYAAAARAILLQHASLGGYANGIDWESEDYDQGPSDAQRTLAVCASTYTVAVASVVNKFAGPGVPAPPAPDTIPGSSWPTVLTTDVEAEKEVI